MGRLIEAVLRLGGRPSSTHHQRTPRVNGLDQKPGSVKRLGPLNPGFGPRLIAMEMIPPPYVAALMTKVPAPALTPSRACRATESPVMGHQVELATSV